MIQDDIVKLIKKEKETNSRFPVRIIFVNTLEQYKLLVKGVMPLCDRVIGLSSYCDSDDTYPRIDRLKDDIVKSTEKCIFVLSLSEYLRIGFRRELPRTHPQFAAIFNMQQDSILKRKVIIPLYACDQIFEQVIGRVDPRRTEHIWRLHSGVKEDKVNYTIYSEVFENVIEQKRVVIGMKEWLRLWDEGINNLEYSLVTKLTKHVDDTKGVCSITKIVDLFQYVRNGLADGEMLVKDWGSSDNWKYISTFLKNKDLKTITEIICEGLNMSKFEPLSVLTTWNNIDDNKKWLFWLWYKLNTSDDYISYAVTNSKKYSNIPRQIRDAVFTMPLHDEHSWLEKRKKALDVLEVDDDEEYFNKINSISDKMRRLRLLSCNSQAEKVLAIKLISQMIDEGETIGKITKLIRDKYEIMVQYLRPAWAFDNEQLNEYFDLFRRHKLINKYDDAITIALAKTHKVLSNIDTRYGVIKKLCQGDQVFIMWVDALGAEWASLLLSRLLNLEPDLFYNIDIGTAIPPTITEINNQWNSMEYPFIKLDRFDKLAHQGVIDDRDYFSCIEKQLQYVDDFAREAIHKLSSHRKVIITADHGVSRIAALAFHALVGINPPEGCIPKSFGRYCEINQEINPSDIHPSVKRVNNYLVFKTHEHFKSSGNAAGVSHGDIALPGEIHGGMTPEEILVPVVAISKDPPKGLDFKIENRRIVPGLDNMISLIINFNKKVKGLKIVSQYQKAQCNSEDGLRWTVVFDNLPPGDHLLDIFADNKLLGNQEKITVLTRGIIINDDL